MSPQNKECVCQYERVTNNIQTMREISSNFIAYMYVQWKCKVLILQNEMK